MIAKSTEDDFDAIYEIINDAAMAYKGHIPEDRWHEPYMLKAELKEEIHNGVEFYCYFDSDQILGVIGIQSKGRVNLIRHAYVRTDQQHKGIGGKLVRFLSKLSQKPMLVGIWKDAAWAIAFYQKNGFQRVSDEEKDILLNKYWIIPERQAESLVILADSTYRGM